MLVEPYLQGAHGSCACWQTCSQPVVSSCLSPSLTIAAAHAGIGWEHTLTHSCLHPESVWHWLGQPVLIASGPGCVDVVLSVRLTWQEPAALIPNGLAESHQRSASLEKVWAKARGSDLRCLPLLSPCTCVLSSQLITDKSFSLPSFAFFFFFMLSGSFVWPPTAAETTLRWWCRIRSGWLPREQGWGCLVALTPPSATQRNTCVALPSVFLTE